MKRSLEMGARAEQSFFALDLGLQRRVLEKLKWFLENNTAPESLEGNLKGLFKLRVGDYRIVYEFESDTHIVVRFIGHRSNAYKNLARD